MTGFAVDHARLANAGTQIAQQSGASSDIARQIQAAQVPTLAWGLLGVSCGLYEMYAGLLADLDRHLADMGQQLDRTGAAMTSTAQAYQAIDQQIAETLQGLEPGTESA